MHNSYDSHILSRRYKVYLAFGRAFGSHRAALICAMEEMSKQGRLVEVMCSAVPDTACQSCGEMLFDWQTTVGECFGTSASDMCFFSLSGGLVCEKCAEHEAGLEVEEREYRGEEMVGELIALI